MAYDNTKEFCKGLYFNETDLTKNIETSEKQFIFFKVSIRKKELIEYLESQNNDDDWINIDVKRSKGGKFYGEVNTLNPIEMNIIKMRSIKKEQEKLIKSHNILEIGKKNRQEKNK